MEGLSAQKGYMYRQQNVGQHSPRTGTARRKIGAISGTWLEPHDSESLLLVTIHLHRML